MGFGHRRTPKHSVSRLPAAMCNGDEDIVSSDAQLVSRSTSSPWCETAGAIPQLITTNQPYGPDWVCCDEHFVSFHGTRGTAGQQALVWNGQRRRGALAAGGGCFGQGPLLTQAPVLWHDWGAYLPRCFMCRELAPTITTAHLHAHAPALHNALVGHAGPGPVETSASLQSSL